MLCKSTKIVISKHAMQEKLLQKKRAMIKTETI